MKEQLISFETAKLAKERGFNIYQPTQYSSAVNPTTEYNYTENQCKLFNDTYYAPTQNLLQKWLREEHHLIVIVAYQYEHDSTPYGYWVYKENNSLPLNQWIHDLHTYEEALEKGLQEALKLI